MTAPGDEIVNIAQQIDALDALAADVADAQEAYAVATTRLLYASRRLAQELREAVRLQQLTGQRRYTETEAAEALRVSVDTLRRMRRRHPRAWPCYTLEGVAGYFYTDAQLGQIASGGYLEAETPGRKRQLRVAA